MGNQNDKNNTSVECDHYVALELMKLKLSHHDLQWLIKQYHRDLFAK